MMSDPRLDADRPSRDIDRSVKSILEQALSVYRIDADRLKPTVECMAMVAPRKFGSAAIDMPDVKAPESAGTVIA